MRKIWAKRAQGMLVTSHRRSAWRRRPTTSRTAADAPRARPVRATVARVIGRGEDGRRARRARRPPLVVVALGFAAGGWACAFMARCADRGDAVVLAAPVAAVVGCLLVARGAGALALLRRRRGAERLAWVKLMAVYLLAMDLVDESIKRRLFRYVPACRTHKVWEWGCSNHPAAPLSLGP